jgi:hypothetical protein
MNHGRWTVARIPSAACARATSVARSAGESTKRRGGAPGLTMTPCRLLADGEGDGSSFAARAELRASLRPHAARVPRAV